MKREPMTKKKTAKMLKNRPDEPITDQPITYEAAFEWLQAAMWARAGDALVKITRYKDSMWACELKYIPRPNNPDGADLGLTFYATGGDRACDALMDCLIAFEQAVPFPTRRPRAATRKKKRR